MRKIVYISGTRADFGLMKNTLYAINANYQFDLNLIVTGMHLLNEYGNSIKEIKDSNLNILGTVKVSLSGSCRTEMSRAIGEQIIGFTKLLQKENPDIILLLGDRGEMLAGAIAAIHLNIPIAHIHGGELSGTIDEPVRHAISKLSHFHFVSTESSQNRLIKMGENPDNIFVTGAPGLDEVSNLNLIKREVILSRVGLLINKPFILLLFHPENDIRQSINKQIITILDSIINKGFQVLAIMPNSDSGSSVIVSVLKQYESNQKIKVFKNFNRTEFLSLVYEANVFVGNSSSGIIESASLGTPFLNLGKRQKHRERNANVIDSPINSSMISDGLDKALDMKDNEFHNIYGDGQSSIKIVNLLKSISLESAILEKINAY